MVNVRSRETQEAESGIDQHVLPAVVLDEALTVVASVILENEPRPGVVQVRPTDEPLLTVTEISLDIWPAPAWISSHRSRVFIGDSAGAESAASERSRRAPARPFVASAWRLRAAASVRPKATTMSIATGASTAGHRRQMSEIVRRSSVARSPRTETISRRAISQRRTLSPSRDRMPERAGTTISTGLFGRRSRPRSQAAVAPAKTASGGSKRCHAESSSQWSSRRPLQQ